MHLKSRCLEMMFLNTLRCWCRPGDTPTDADLTPADQELLAKWVNPVYLTPDAWNKIQSKFEADGSVQLQNFLAAPVAEQVLKAVLAADSGSGRVQGAVPGFDYGCETGERVTQVCKRLCVGTCAVGHISQAASKQRVKEHGLHVRRLEGIPGMALVLTAPPTPHPVPCACHATRHPAFIGTAAA